MAKPLLRAYSIASPAWDEELEFYSIKVPDGPLTSKLQHIQVGDEIILRPKPVGTLVHDALSARQTDLLPVDRHRALPPSPAFCVSPRPTRNTSRSS